MSTATNPPTIEAAAAMIPAGSAAPLANALPDLLADPEKMLQRAEKVAKTLVKFLKRKPGPVLMFDGKRYPTAEDWQLVGTFFGHTARVREVVDLRDDAGFVIGYKAIADVIDAQGNLVTSAEAACERSERNWQHKPHFQLRSMAQTRACAKAMRNKFAWVMVLAGLAPTPAEEMDFGPGGGGGKLAADICRECGMDMDAGDVGEAMRDYGRVLCRVCRKGKPTKLEEGLKKSVAAANEAKQRANGGAQ